MLVRAVPVRVPLIYLPHPHACFNFILTGLREKHRSPLSAVGQERRVQLLQLLHSHK